jgi:hypothetical protein
VELIEPVYNNIRIIISVVIPVVVSSSSLVESPAQGGIIFRPIVYFDLSINKKRNSRKNIIDSG